MQRGGSTVREDMNKGKPKKQTGIFIWINSQQQQQQPLTSVSLDQ
jgi:hypothetical protein